MAGLNHASGNVIVIMDDDLQHSPADVPRLYEMILQGYDVCYAQFGHVHHALWKRLGSAFNDRVASILLDKPSGIYLSSFKALSAGLRDEIVKYTGPYAYIDGLVLMTTSNIAVIESDHNERFEGKGNYSLSKSIGLWAKMATSFSILPLRLSGIIGILMAFAGFLIAAVAVFLRLFTDLPIPLGWTSLLVSGIVIGGTQLVALWMIGEYLGRAYVRSNNIPQYSIKDYRNIDPDMASAIRSHTEK
jgi:undecaprenyl-phosphate 4-deoxy-4-formamido-L-arabinose transferase